MSLTRRQFTGLFAAATAAGAHVAKGFQMPYHVAWVPETKVSFKDWDFGGGKMFCFANRASTQMLSTVFVSKGGHVAVVDGGYFKDGDFLFDRLMALGGKVDYWFITHAHEDHYGALSTMMKRPDFTQLKISNLIYSFPDLEWIEKAGEKNSRKLTTAFLEQLKTAGKHIPCRRYVKGEIIRMDGIAFEVLNDYNLDIITCDPVNGTSICLGVTMGKKRILVTGDVSANEGAWLAKVGDPQKFKADICFLSHHGQTGAPKAFYEMVKMEAAIWPCPKWLWDNDSGKGPGSGPWATNYTKCWMQELGVKKNYVLSRDYVFE